MAGNRADESRATVEDAIDVDDLETLTPSQSAYLHVNIGSMPANWGNFESMLGKLEEKNCKPDVIMICETWLTPKNCKSYNIPGYNLVEKHRTISRGGGVALYIKENLAHKERDDLSEFIEGEYESVFAEISNQNIIVGEVYRPPATSKTEFLAKHKEILEKITREGKRVVVGADQNIDLFKSAARKFIKLNAEHGMAQTVKQQATRVALTSRSKSSTLIDNIYVTTSGFPNATSHVLLNCDISDHYPVLLCHNVSRVSWLRAGQSVA